MKINKLKDNLSDMIAAGEVIERIASVVKELVENSIDAKATEITIEIKDTGKSLIKVTDNGFGMDSEDVLVSVLRHYTSKIEDVSDLFHIKSLGFRGEALASIASVSKLSILSKIENKDPFFAYFEGGTLIESGYKESNVGTTITVQSLFYNTPARYKFIKSDQVELNYIYDCFNDLVFSHPNIRFCLIVDSKVVRQTYGQGPKKTLALIYNIEQNIIEVSDISKLAKITLYLVPPTITKTRKKDIHLFVNNRAVTNYYLINSVVEGYSSSIMLSRYPISLVYIDIDYSLVDVNVSPQKTIVKINNEILLSNIIKTIIKNALTTSTIQIPNRTSTNINFFENKVKDTFELREKADAFIDNNLINSETDLFTEEESTSKFPKLEVIGCYDNTFILATGIKGLYLLDTHASHERIRYEYYLKKIKYNNERISLLIPYQIAINDSDLLLLDKYKTQIQEFGFKIENKFIYEYPSWLKSKDIVDAIDIIIESLTKSGLINNQELINRLAKSISCKGAIKAHDRIDNVIASELIKELENCEYPYTCPHGRPTIICITDNEIKKYFMRII